MIDSKKLHIDNNYFIKLTNSKNKDILVATMPSNIILEIPETTTIYELENEHVTIYRNKEKFCTKKCPDYSKRTVVWGHLLRLLEDRNICDIPVITELDGVLVENCNTLDNILPIFTLLEEPVKNADIELEIKLVDTISKYSQNNSNIPKDVWDGFVATFDVFRGD